MRWLLSGVVLLLVAAMGTAQTGGNAVRNVSPVAAVGNLYLSSNVPLVAGINVPATNLGGLGRRVIVVRPCRTVPCCRPPVVLTSQITGRLNHHGRTVTLTRSLSTENYPPQTTFALTVTVTRDAPPTTQRRSPGP
jgi:hypothetical protein